MTERDRRLGLTGCAQVILGFAHMITRHIDEKRTLQTLNHLRPGLDWEIVSVRRLHLTGTLTADTRSRVVVSGARAISISGTHFDPRSVPSCTVQHHRNQPSLASRKPRAEGTSSVPSCALELTSI